MMSFSMRRCDLLAGAAVLAVFAAPVPAFAQQQTFQFDIKAQSLDGALRAFAHTTRQQVLFDGATVRGKRSVALTGAHSADQALAILLAGSGLEAVRGTRGAYVVRAARSIAQSQAAEGDSETAQAEVVVTGSHIRGGESASPTITIGRKQFKEEGFTDLGGVIRSIPQNFRGGQNPGTASGATFGGNANQDGTGGSSLNLRGLGPDATLTLLNGRRLSYDGLYQAIDISAIPIAAVERVDIVPDGASAIYGSDAVAGVANVVLRRDFSGLTVGALRGGATEGGLARHEYNATAGAIWKTGGALATFITSDQNPIYANQRSYTTTMFQPFTIYPGSTLRSGLISAHQSVGGSIMVGIDMFRTVREQELYRAQSTSYIYEPRKTSTNMISPNAKISINDWSINLGGSIGRSDIDDLLFQTAGGVTSAYGHSRYRNETSSWELGADGPLLSLGSRSIRTAMGVGGRRDEFLGVSDAVNNSRYEGSQGNRYAYAEIAFPIFGDEDSYRFLRRLDFSAALRGEDYDSFGRVVTPKLGVVYDPSYDLSLKASWGKSFKAPSLFQRYYYRYSYLLKARDYGCQSCNSTATVLMSSGGSPNLQPERGNTWTASVALHPKALSRFNAELTYFHIDYNQRIAEPISNYARALSDPAFSQFVITNPTAAQQQALINEYNYAFLNQSGSTYDPANVVAIVQAQYANVTRQRVHGVDLSGGYRFDIGAGKLELRGSGTWLNLSRQNSSNVGEIELSGSIYYPAKFNGRLGAVWTDGGFNLSVFGNHTSGSTSNITSVTQRLSSFTTLDATMRYETKEGRGVFSGLAFALTIDNLLNRAPPLFTPPSGRYVPYDSTNASAIGRYVTFSVSKHFF